jgi:hypothetical protein
MIGAAHTTKIGDKLVLQAKAPSSSFVVVFEDDGDTGYLYALAPGASGEMELLDALHIYNAEADLRGTDVRLELAWSEDGERAGLRVNTALWALFDFPRQTGWSRSNFPPPAGRWRMDGERPSWNDALIHEF